MQGRCERRGGDAFGLPLKGGFGGCATGTTSVEQRSCQPRPRAPARRSSQYSRRAARPPTHEGSDGAWYAVRGTWYAVRGGTRYLQRSAPRGQPLDRAEGPVASCRSWSACASSPSSPNASRSGELWPVLACRPTRLHCPVPCVVSFGSNDSQLRPRSNVASGSLIHLLRQTSSFDAARKSPRPVSVHVCRQHVVRAMLGASASWRP
jgi:hypothetical protein